jgi:methyl acetate hydrolase
VILRRLPACPQPLAASRPIGVFGSALFLVSQLALALLPVCQPLGGINNTFFWIDPARGIAGVIMMQYLPFADAKALAVYDTFERGAYQLVNAER